MTRRLPIRVVSDVVCPWCFIGHRHLAAALDLVGDVEAELDWLPYQLHPYVPRQGADMTEHYEKKFGGDFARLRGQVIEAGRSAGIAFEFDRISRVPNTLSAHLLIRWSPAGEGRTRAVDRLFDAYFLEGKDIGETSTLIGLAAELGLDANAIGERLSSEEDREIVAAEADAIRRQGITGVPFFLIDDRLPIMGAQPPEAMAQIIERALAERDSARADAMTGA